MRQFLIILFVLFLIQLPNWYFILGRNSGGIDDFGNENWITVSDLVSTIFSFPIYFFVRDKIDSYGLAFMIYMVDLVLISLILHLAMNGIKKLRIQYGVRRPATKLHTQADMKGLLFLLFTLGLSYCSFGQLTGFMGIRMTETPTIKYDTTYFDSGQIETITSRSWFVPASNRKYKVQEIKTVYQYDKCGHWRNTTTILEDNDPMSYGVFGPRRWQEDKLAIGGTCDVPWTKPLIL